MPVATKRCVFGAGQPWDFNGDCPVLQATAKSRRLVPCRLNLMNASVSSVGAGAPSHCRTAPVH